MTSDPIADTAALEFRGVWRSYAQADRGELHALRDVSLHIARGRRVAIIGRSGSGKSTLLHLAAAIDTPTRGEVLLDGRDVAELSDRERTLVRRQRVGLVFQFFHLLPQLSVLDNVGLPARIAGERHAAWEPEARALLDRVGLDARRTDRVDRLSGGEMQRVAICRALLRRPPLLLADEPTGNLDDATGRVVMDLLLALVSERGSTLIYVTHSDELAALADEVYRLHSGTLEGSQGGRG